MRDDKNTGFKTFTYELESEFLRYEDFFEDSKLSGRGKFLWKDGKVSEGKFKNGPTSEEKNE